MPRRSLTGGVRAKGTNRIQFEFWFQGTRYRPTILRRPTAANLRRACVQLARIDQAIADGTFDFAAEFPSYRLKSRAPPRYSSALRTDIEATTGQNTCADVFKAFLAHCEARVSLSDMAYSTYLSYRQILESVWVPRIGEDRFLDVTYSRLQSTLESYATRTEHSREDEPGARARKPLSKRTYNNIASVLRCAFEFGYKDHLDKHDPALRLKTLRITKRDKEPINPFTIQEAETIIARSHAQFGGAHGNYEEFRFFTGLRQSEAFALMPEDYDRHKGTLAVRRARVRKREKDRTKTNEDREIALCARAQAVLERQLALREPLVQSGWIQHEFIFFQDDGAPLQDLSYPYRRWRHVLEAAGIRYREPYNARHSFISWSLMVGKNLLKLAQEDGHSIQTMLSTYAAWTQDATEADVAIIKRAMEHAPKDRDGGGAALELLAKMLTRPLASKARPRERLRWRNHRQAILAWRKRASANPHQRTTAAAPLTLRPQGRASKSTQTTMRGRPEAIHQFASRERDEGHDLQRTRAIWHRR